MTMTMGGGGGGGDMKINDIYKVCYMFTFFQIVLTRSSKVEVFTQPISLLQSSDFIHFSSHRFMLHVSDENLTFRKIISLSLFFYYFQ